MKQLSDQELHAKAADVAPVMERIITEVRRRAVERGEIATMIPADELVAAWMTTHARLLDMRSAVPGLITTRAGGKD